MKSDTDIGMLLAELQGVAKRKVKEKGQFTEFTGLIGELAVCQKELKEAKLRCGCTQKEKKRWKWDPGAYYDASDPNANCNYDKIQIKTRRLQRSDNLKAGRMGRFGSARTKNTETPDKYCFNRGVLVVLDKDFGIAEIWELDKEIIRDLEEDKKQNSKNEKLLGLHLSTFINAVEKGKGKQYKHDNYKCFRENEWNSLI